MSATQSEQDNFGRRPESIADMEAVLNDIFWGHPAHTVTEDGTPALPAQYFADVCKTFAEQYHGQELFDDSGKESVDFFINNHPDLAITPQALLNLIAQLTKGSPKASSSEEDLGYGDDEWRGRDDDRDGHQSSRSSSSDSSVRHGSRPPSRPGSRASLTRAPSQSSASLPESPFDTSRRQRSTPLSTAPSSWTRPPPTSRRRKSDAGGPHSDSEDNSNRRTSRPSSRQGGRVRVPSTPSSPTLSASSPPTSFPSFTIHTRSQSQPYHNYGSPSPPDSPTFDDRTYRYASLSPENSFADSINSLAMPTSADLDDDEDGLVMDPRERALTLSNASMEPNERMEALQKTNQDLRYQIEQERQNFTKQLESQESEIEDLQIRLEETKSELQATKREEKELRNKERSYITQIATLENEVSKISRQLETSKASYASLQKQYAEQCAESERYRNNLRRRDEEIKDLQDSASLQKLESDKFARGEQIYEERIASMLEELNSAREAYRQLEEQKQENMMLKETIDRMRFDMDELRTNVTSGIATTAGGSGSAQASISKSLGAELAGQMKDTQWNEGSWDQEEENVEDDSVTAVDSEIAHHHEDTDGEEEDVIQTIITRKKKKVTSRANQPPPMTIHYEESKEYADMQIQVDPTEYSRTLHVQTDPEPRPTMKTFEIQTEWPTSQTFVQTEVEPEPVPRVTTEMNIQTDPVEEPRPSSSRQPRDLPPDYAQATEEDIDGLPLSQLADPESRKFLAIQTDTLRSCHRGAKFPLEPLDGGVSEDAIEEWNALKEELGLDCVVIDTVIARSQPTGQPRPGKNGKIQSRIRRSRFYNIYNTYVYGGGNKEGNSNGPSSNNPPSSFTSTAAAQILLGIGASAIFFLAMGPYSSAQYTPLGGATYYDRAAWSSFNSMHPTGEGIAPDGTAAVWSILGRVGGGAARIAQGWPT